MNESTLITHRTRSNSIHMDRCHSTVRTWICVDGIKAQWGDWESDTWATAGNFTWKGLAGDIFVTTADPSTTWTNVGFPTESTT